MARSSEIVCKVDGFLPTHMSPAQKKRFICGPKRQLCLSRQRLYSDPKDDVLVLPSCLTHYLGGGRGWEWGEIIRNLKQIPLPHLYIMISS